MTTGQIMFYCGLSLLGLTIITTIIFLLKRPKYIPENAVYEKATAGHTQRLRNGYPTERETIRREKPQDSPLPPTELVETEKLEHGTAAIFQTDVLPQLEETELLSSAEETEQ